MMSLTFFIIALLGVGSAQKTDVCSQVQLMSQYCTSQGDDVAAGEVATMKVLEERMEVKLKEIEARLRHTLGDPPEINYTLVEETIVARFKGVEERVIARLGTPPEVNYTAIEETISARFARLEALVNGAAEDGSSVVDYSRIFGQVDNQYTAIRSYIDSKFALLVNDTEAHQTAVETMDKRMHVTDCREIRQEDAKLCNATGGVFDIYRGRKKYEVFCDSYTDGGGWTVFQRRMNGTENFNRTWKEYVNGFGAKHREFWLGLQNIHELLQSGTHELRIELMDSAGRVRFAEYRIFYVSGKSRDYDLMIQSFTGDLSDRLVSNIRFATIDNDPGSYKCANRYNGGWWYNRNCASRCYSNCNLSALNGNVIYWSGFSDIVRSEMKFRRLQDD